MTALLTRDQADLLAAYGWQTADLLLDPDEAISHAKGSMSCAVGEAWSWSTLAKGIVGRRGRHPMAGHEPHADDVTVPWSLIRAAGKAVPGELAADLGSARGLTRREWARYLTEFCGWAPGGRAAWVEPPPAWHRDAQASQHQAMLACLDVLAADPDEAPGQLNLFELAQ